MYRKHDSEHVVDVDNVWPLIPITDETYQAWLAAGNVPLERIRSLEHSRGYMLGTAAAIGASMSLVSNYLIRAFT
jgi:hypothetical protein